MDEFRAVVLKHGSYSDEELQTLSNDFIEKPVMKEAPASGDASRVVGEVTRAEVTDEGLTCELTIEDEHLAEILSDEIFSTSIVPAIIHNEGEEVVAHSLFPSVAPSDAVGETEKL